MQESIARIFTKELKETVTSGISVFERKTRTKEVV